jgi:hypothetical protein
MNMTFLRNRICAPISGQEAVIMVRLGSYMTRVLTARDGRAQEECHVKMEAESGATPRDGRPPPSWKQGQILPRSLQGNVAPQTPQFQTFSLQNGGRENKCLSF